MREQQKTRSGEQIIVFVWSLITDEHQIDSHTDLNILYIWYSCLVIHSNKVSNYMAPLRRILFYFGYRTYNIKVCYLVTSVLAVSVNLYGRPQRWIHAYDVLNGVYSLYKYMYRFQCIYLYRIPMMYCCNLYIVFMSMTCKMSAIFTIRVCSYLSN